MKPFLLDTNVIVDALRKRNERHLLVDHLLDQGQPLASCPTTLTEIYAGMRPSETDTGFHEKTSVSRHNGGYRRAGRALEGAVCEARQDTLVPRRQHRRGMHRVRLHARHRGRQGFPYAGGSDLSPLPESYVAKRTL